MIKSLRLHEKQVVLMQLRKFIHVKPVNTFELSLVNFFSSVHCSSVLLRHVVYMSVNQSFSILQVEAKANTSQLWVQGEVHPRHHFDTEMNTYSQSHIWAI